MEDEITVLITAQHFRKAFSFASNCPLEMALKELFPSSKLDVKVVTAQIDSDIYSIPEEWGRHYATKYHASAIDDLILEARREETEIPSVELILKKI